MSPNTKFFAVLAAVCTAVFAPGLTSELIHYDDGIYLGGNPVMLMTGWEGFSEVWSSGRAWRGEYVEFFPLRDSIYWVLAQLFGFVGWPFHVASLLFHIASTVLVFVLVSRLDPSPWVARVAALLFAVHPIHVESVTWAASLKDPMYTAFMLGSVLAYLRYRERLTTGSYVASLLLLICALLTKSMALVMPLLLVGLELVFKTPLKTIIARVIAPGLISAIFTAQFIGIGMAKKIVGQPHGGTWTSHWVLAAWAQAKYLAQTVAPRTFELIECFEPAKSYADPRFFAGLGALALVALAAFFWRKQPLRLFFISWYFICLLPVSNLVPFPAVMADRYLYAASLAVCWLVASVLDTSLARLKNVIAGAAILTLGVTTAYRTSLWHNEDDLWAATDEDPKCLIDPEFPAAQSHLIRSWTAPTRELKLQAIERGLASPAYKDPVNAENRCDLLVPGIPLAIGFGQHDKALEWARQAIRGCPKRASAWNAAMMTTLHRAPELAHTAAQQAAKLEPVPIHQLLEALTALEVRFDEQHVAAAKAAVARAPELTCGALATWRSEVSPELAQHLADVASLCH